MITRCPAPPELLLLALQRPDDRASRETARHVDQCASCQATVLGMCDVALALPSDDAGATDTGVCLDEMTVARIAEQGVDMAVRRDLISHLGACAQCRNQVVSVGRLLRNASVADEVGRNEAPTALPVTRRRQFASAGTLAALAAAAVAFMFAGSGDRGRVTPTPTRVPETETHREQSVTTTAAPSPIAPLGSVAAADTFRWTSVPRADRYRLTLFDTEGTVVWEAEGSDTAMAPPASIVHDPGAAFLWKVEARTGWDRWVASELFEFSVPRSGRIP